MLRGVSLSRCTLRGSTRSPGVPCWRCVLQRLRDAAAGGFTTMRLRHHIFSALPRFSIARRQRPTRRAGGNPGGTDVASGLQLGSGAGDGGHKREDALIDQLDDRAAVGAARPVALRVKGSNINNRFSVDSQTRVPPHLGERRRGLLPKRALLTAPPCCDCGRAPGLTETATVAAEGLAPPLVTAAGDSRPRPPPPPRSRRPSWRPRQPNPARERAGEPRGTGRGSSAAPAAGQRQRAPSRRPPRHPRRTGRRVGTQTEGLPKPG